MIHLTKALTFKLGNALTFDNSLNPSQITYCSVPLGLFSDAAREMQNANAMLAAEWATDETLFGRGYSVYACYRWGGEYLIVRADMPVSQPEFPSLTGTYVAAYRFERQIHSLMGIKPLGHADLRPWIKFEDWPPGAWPLRKTFDGTKYLERVNGVYAWARAEGDGVYEIPVGPVHAGIIEPGHFRFQAVGETIINLEERLGYVHKGIEKRFESMTWPEGAALAARISGDTTVAHGVAYAIAVEAVTGCNVPERAKWLRALFLERERIANHIGDIGAICNDVAFAFVLYQTARLREIMLRTNLKLFGHRFIMDRVRPGGVTADITSDGKREILEELDRISVEFERIVKIIDESSSLDDRIRDTGVLNSERARELCVVGIVARASGLNVDCRAFNPVSPYDGIGINVPVYIAGDAHARTWVRIDEVRESMRIIRHILEKMPEGPLSAPLGIPAPDTSGFAAVEGWRGEIICWVQAGPRGEINRVMVRDPSSLNWIGLEQCIPGNIVPDFPLCNKSFNQSYSGHDL